MKLKGLTLIASMLVLAGCPDDKNNKNDSASCKPNATASQSSFDEYHNAVVNNQMLVVADSQYVKSTFALDFELESGTQVENPQDVTNNPDHDGDDTVINFANMTVNATGDGGRQLSVPFVQDLNLSDEQEMPVFELDTTELLKTVRSSLNALDEQDIEFCSVETATVTFALDENTDKLYMLSEFTFKVKIDDDILAQLERSNGGQDPGDVGALEPEEPGEFIEN